MNHNPHNLKVGDTVILDEEYNNASEVEIISFTPDELTAFILSPEDGDRWVVMTSRLTPITNSKSTNQ